MAVQYQRSAASAIAASGRASRAGAEPGARAASHQSVTRAMNAGSTMTSRDSHEVRHMVAALADRTRHVRIGILDVAEQARAGRACLHARRLAVVGREGRVLDAIDAERALGHHLARLVDLARTVRARPRAVLAGDALVVVD